MNYAAITLKIITFCTMLSSISAEAASAEATHPELLKNKIDRYLHDSSKESYKYKRKVSILYSGIEQRYIDNVILVNFSGVYNEDNLRVEHLSPASNIVEDGSITFIRGRLSDFKKSDAFAIMKIISRSSNVIEFGITLDGLKNTEYYHGESVYKSYCTSVFDRISAKDETHTDYMIVFAGAELDDRDAAECFSKNLSIFATQ